MEHELKCHPEHYAAIDGGWKTLELRFNDRPYAHGDALRLREFDPIEAQIHYEALCDAWQTQPHDPSEVFEEKIAAFREEAQLHAYTGRQLRVRVTHILSGGPWLAPGYVAMSIRLMGEDGRARVQEDFRPRFDTAMAQIHDASAALHAAGIDAEPHTPHEGCQTQLGHRVRELAAKLGHELPEGYESVTDYIKEINKENNLFTFQSAEARFLLREILQLSATHQGWVPIEGVFATRIRAVLDEPESAPERERAYRDMLKTAQRERDILHATLDRLYGAVLHDMTAHDLPHEWSADSAMAAASALLFSPTTDHAAAALLRQAREGEGI